MDKTEPEEQKQSLTGSTSFRLAVGLMPLGIMFYGLSAYQDAQDTYAQGAPSDETYQTAISSCRIINFDDPQAEGDCIEFTEAGLEQQRLEARNDARASLDRWVYGSKTIIDTLDP